jgi:hypothetical protein
MYREAQSQKETHANTEQGTGLEKEKVRASHCPRHRARNRPRLMARKGQGIVEGTCKDIKNSEQGFCKGTEQGTETS